VADALPFLGFRLQRVLNAKPARSPEERARVAEQAMTVVNEHPDVNVRKLYAAQVASHVGLAAADLVAVAERPRARPHIQVAAPRRRVGEDAEFVAIALLLQRWNDIAEWLVEDLFNDDVARRAFLAVAEAGGDVGTSLELADPDAREMIERAAVADGEWDPARLAFTLIADQVRRELRRVKWTDDVDAVRADQEARLAMHRLDDPASAPAAAEALLQWLQRPKEESD
jgi:DNA primase